MKNVKLHYLIIIISGQETIRVNETIIFSPETVKP